MNKIKMSLNLPTGEEFVNLRLLAGMSIRDSYGATIGLKNSNYVVTFIDEDLLVGMGRIIGDGMTTFQIVDVVVHPNYQGKGLGKAIMTQLINWLSENATPNSYVSLISDGKANFLYEKFGFKETMPNSMGMHMFI